KTGIHPEYKEATIKCACGTTYKTRSTRGDMSVEICSNCHPFYTGQQRVVDSAGRVDRFKKKYKLK
ncbi:MAG TPA: 50S ribosomal protein L31, partial [Leptospiraceae bacterium]|nr:50S ribosomal protein L31 [Leptospiraceae bacterium]